MCKPLEFECMLPSGTYTKATEASVDPYTSCSGISKNSKFRMLCECGLYGAKESQKTMFAVAARVTIFSDGVHSKM